MCIFRAMSTGLKMQYPEVVKENGKKSPKIHHLFVINFIFLYSKTGMAQTDVWVKQSRAPLALLPADLHIFFVRGLGAQEVQPHLCILESHP